MDKQNSRLDVVSFYLGNTADQRGRMISEIWLKNYEWLEYTHDYIQWIFPLRGRSGYNPAAPVLDDETIEAFRSSKELRSRLLRSLALMLKFYGFELLSRDAEKRITKSIEYEERKLNWVSKGNHNFLRMTRILASLRILGLEDHAGALFRCLSEVYQDDTATIGTRTFAFWKSAAAG